MIIHSKLNCPIQISLSSFVNEYKDVCLTSLGQLAFLTSTSFLKPTFHTTILLWFSSDIWAFLLNLNCSFKYRSSSGCNYHNFLCSFYVYSLGNLIHTYILSYIYADDSQNIVAVESYTQVPLAISNQTSQTNPTPLPILFFLALLIYCQNHKTSVTINIYCSQEWEQLELARCWHWLDLLKCLGLTGCKMVWFGWLGGCGILALLHMYLIL